MILVVRVDRRRRHPALWLRVSDVVEVGLPHSMLASCASELFQEISPEASVNRGSRTQPVDFRDQTMRWNTESSAIWLLG